MLQKSLVKVEVRFMKRTIGNKLNDYKHLKPPGSEFLPRLVMIRRAVNVVFRRKIVVEYVVYINGSIMGNEILQSFTNNVPDFIDDAYICVKGDLIIDIDDEFGDVEEIRVFNSNGKVVFCCYDAEVLQQYLVGVEIVKVENLE